MATDVTRGPISWNFYIALGFALSPSQSGTIIQMVDVLRFPCNVLLYIVRGRVWFGCSSSMGGSRINWSLEKQLREHASITPPKMPADTLLAVGGASCPPRAKRPPAGFPMARYRGPGEEERGGRRGKRFDGRGPRRVLRRGAHQGRPPPPPARALRARRSKTLFGRRSGRRQYDAPDLGGRTEALDALIAPIPSPEGGRQLTAA